MNDDNKGSQKNQSGSIFETVPFEDTSTGPVQNNTSDSFESLPPDFAADIPPLYEENKSKYFVIAGAVIVFILVFVGVIGAVIFLNRGGNGNADNNSLPEATEPVTLTYWSIFEEPEVMQPIIDEYQAANPNVTINFEKRDPTDQYRERLIARSESGVGPDIFRFHNTWLPQIRQIVAPLPEQIMPADEFKQTFYPIHQTDLSTEDSPDTFYGLPTMIDGLVLVYNENLFERAGIATPPTSWVPDVPRVVEDLTVLNSDQEIVTAGIAMGTAENVAHFSELYGLLLLQNGASLETLGSNQAAEALEVYVQFAEEGFWNNDLPNSVEAFAQEKVAMIIVPSWQILVIKAINPDVQLQVTSVPRGLTGEPLSLANYWVEGVNRTAAPQNQIEAWKFLHYLTSKEILPKLYEQQTKVRLFGAPYSRVDLGDQLIDNQYLGAVIEQAESFQSLPVATRTYDGGLNDEMSAYIKDAINSSLRGVSYNEALETVQSGYNQLIKNLESAPASDAESQ